jgi:hypothetical protein
MKTKRDDAWARKVDLEKMTNEINEKIAKACGWRIERVIFHTVYVWEPDDKFPSRLYPMNVWNKIPKYCNNLNAMHNAEKTLKEGLRNTYDAELGLIAERDHCFIWETTALQKAEAFLKTINDWREPIGFED